MTRKRLRVTTQRRVVAGIRCCFVYDARRLDVSVEPNDGDLAAAPVLSLLRFWAMIDVWAKGVADDNPGWTVCGETPNPDPDDPDCED